MRKAHILTRDAKGEAKLTADGDYAETKSKYEKGVAPVGGTIEFFSKLGIKIKKGAPIKKAAAILSILAVALSAFSQADITGNMPVVELYNASGSTNAGPGSGLIGWNIDSIAVLSASVIMTNTPHISTLSNLFVRFDTSVNGTDWLIGQYKLTVAATATTVSTVNIARITNTIGAKWLRVGAVENANTNRAIISRLMFQTQ